MTTSPTIHVRPARYTDADAMCDAQVQGWRTAYRGLFPDAYLDADEFDAVRRTWWRGGSWLDNATTCTLAGEIDGEVVGFSVVGPERVDGIETAGDGGEVYSFYLRPVAWGSGLATTLMTASEEWLRSRGFGQASLWALRDNSRARRFYEKVGWSWVGRESMWAGPAMPGVDTPNPVAEVQYTRPL
ncbi:MAG: acetyltransferase [Ilumatobacteraceae bacterium]|nr:acetyltransferase [Ilumatobacteraceae bacterium]